MPSSLVAFSSASLGMWGLKIHESIGRGLSGFWATYYPCLSPLFRPNRSLGSCQVIVMLLVGRLSILLLLLKLGDHQHYLFHYTSNDEILASISGSWLNPTFKTSISFSKFSTYPLLFLAP